MDYVLIGSGNLATHLGPALLSAGHRCLCVCSPTRAHAADLARRLECDFATATDRLPRADVCIFAVKDDALAETIARTDCTDSHTVYVHTSGSMPMALFEGRAPRHGVLYPLQTFSRARMVDFRSVPCFIEADSDETLSRLREVARSISAKVCDLSSDRRRTLHLAAVFANNFANHCYARAEELLHACGLPFEVLLPLIDETAAKVHALPPAQAQTGPALRYDRRVMEAHLSLIDGEETREIYRLMSKSIHTLQTKLNPK